MTPRSKLAAGSPRQRARLRTGSPRQRARLRTGSPRQRARLLRLPAWIGIAVAVVALLIVAGVDDGGLETDGERVQRLSESFACPQCRGQSVAESNAAVAATIRQFISDSVTEGRTDTEIRDDLLRSYRARVLLNPPAEGITTLVWVLPVVLVVVGAVGVAGAITRNRSPDRDPTAEDRDLVARARERRR